MFGAAPESPQREDTPCRPETPYATAKLAAHQLVGQLRGNDGLFACSGILYNHESERRPESFVTRKITRAAAAIKLGLAERVELGDLCAVRDWSFAGDVMHGAWLMLQQDEPDDYILASGVGHTVAEFAEAAFACVGLRAEDHVSAGTSLRRPRSRRHASATQGGPGSAWAGGLRCPSSSWSSDGRSRSARVRVLTRRSLPGLTRGPYHCTECWTD